MSTKAVLITGCSAGGIGSSLVQAFQKRGLHVFATARSLSKMSHLENQPNVTLLSLDVTSTSSISAALEVVKVYTGGTLDYLINNAGNNYITPILDADIEEGKKLFDVNLWGVLAVTQAFAPLVIAAKGSIVNICSIAAHACSPWMSLYSASKAAVEMLSETLRLEMAPLGVNVLSVVTGGVNTIGTSNTPPVHLPSSSRYKAVEANIAAKARGEDGHARMEANVFADKVVSDVLDGVNGRTWRGQMASIMRIFSLLPTFIQDNLVIKGTGLDSFPAGRVD